MYFDINGQIIEDREIICILDLDSATVQKGTRDFLKSEQEKGRLVYEGSDIPRSFIITKEKTYLCSMNSKTIEKRIADI